MPEPAGTGRKVRILWEQTTPKGGGPKKMMWALHRALRRRMEQGLDWLEFGKRIKRGRLHWIWHVPMRHLAVRLAKRNEPFLLGPNVLFEKGLDGKLLDVDRRLLDASSCRVLFAHSDWEADLVRERMGPHFGAEVVCWVPTVDPVPEGPVMPAEHDVLIYTKNPPRAGTPIEEIVAWARERFASTTLLRYGSYERQELYELARRSRSCLYLTRSETGGLATQEIMLAGCPLVATPRGAPLVADGETGVWAAEWAIEAFARALDRALQLDREAVRRRALELFDLETTTDQVLACLDDARRR